jgi:uncharacterized C2H2 Zn-finger protein
VENGPGLSAKATGRIYKHTVEPLLAEPSFKEFHPLVRDCDRRMRTKEMVCLRDVEKALLLTAPERTKVAGLYLDFCLTTIRCIQATVQYISDQEQTRPRDPPYSSGYFLNLVQQIQGYAQQLADSKNKPASDDPDTMDVDPTDEIKLHGGIHVNGRPAELVRIKRNGKAVSMATGQPVDEVEEEGSGAVRIKRSASEELEDEEEIMRSMARRKKNASLEELAPKRCREPGCKKEFKRPCDLTKHEKTHSRPWKCPVVSCKYHDYGWPTEKEMDRHHNDKHSAAPPTYECLYPPCPYKSKRESNCKQHMEKAHGWTYVRTKSNGKKAEGASESLPPSSTAQPTPQLQNISTPTSDFSMSVATPPDDLFGHTFDDNYGYPTFIQDADVSHYPAEMNLDFAVDNGTPSTDSGVDHNSAYQDLGADFTQYEDIYAANVQLPSPVYAPLAAAPITKDLARQLAAFSAAELCQTHPAPHFSPTGQGNTMLFTPTSLADVDEDFEEFPACGVGNNNGLLDFVLFPGASVPLLKSMPATFDPLSVGVEVPSAAAGYTQPSSQDFINLDSVDWSSGNFTVFSQH